MMGGKVFSLLYRKENLNFSLPQKGNIILSLHKKCIAVYISLFAASCPRKYKSEEDIRVTQWAVCCIYGNGCVSIPTFHQKFLVSKIFSIIALLCNLSKTFCFSITWIRVRGLFFWGEKLYHVNVGIAQVSGLLNQLSDLSGYLGPFSSFLYTFLVKQH